MQCFDLRFMWRFVFLLFLDIWFALRTNNSANGIGELYSYLPLTSNNADILAKVPPKTIESNNYGFSVGRGALTFHRGAWNTIAERISLNDPGKSNGKYCSAPLKKNSTLLKIYISGKIQIWINGTTVLHVEGLQMRNTSASVFKGMHFQTFFGGAFYPHFLYSDRASLSCG